ncbi:alpha/beta hydrolase [Mycolicibacterium sp. XJ1904]
MVDRFLVWLRAGIVTAGLSAAILAGAGAAIADDGSSSDGGGSSASESSNSADGAKDSAANESSASTASSRASNATAARTTGSAPRTRVGAKAPDDTKDAKGSDATDKAGGSEDKKKSTSTPKDADTATAEAKDAETAATVTDDAPAHDVVVEQPVVEQLVTEQPVVDDPAIEVPTTEPEVIEEVATSRSDRDHTDQRSTAVVSPNAATVNRESTTGPTEADTAAKRAALVAETDHTVDPAAAEERTAVVLEQPAATVVEDTEQFGVHAVAFASAPPAVTTATAPQIPLILRVIGTIVFDLYAVATRLLGGPPILPPNSTVTVRSSTLRIDCACAEGEGQEVPADWYIPQTAEGAPPPDRLVYLQHGFLATAPWYSHTAAALAERTNSIVVAPSISSNFFALDGCWLGGAPMHEAMAGLFDDENTALLKSARAAGYSGPIPDRVVLMGHSLGGGAVSGMAGYMVDKQTVDRLAGVVLLDGVALGDPARMTESLRKVPHDIPIYQLAAPVYMWNNFGAGLDATLAARPGQFVGVTLVNGSHVDAMRGGNPLIQFAQELVAGFSRPENSAAAQMLMVGWVNDMFDPAGDKEGVYLQPGEQYSFDTPAGRATVVALPNTLTKPFLLNFLEPFMPLADGFFSLDPVCARESVGSAGAGHCNNAVAA